MKKIILISFAFLMLFSCAKENKREGFINQRSSLQFKQIEDYYYFGDIHNEYMDHVCTNFNPIAQNATAAITELNEFLTQFVPTNTSLNPELSTEINSLVDGPDYFKAEFLKTKALSDETQNIISNAVVAGVIDNDEADIFRSILNLANSNPSFEQLNSHIDSLILIWDANQYEQSSSLGEYSAILLAISKRSTEWWLENPRCLFENESRIAPWLAVDAAGAAVGGALHMGSYYANNGSLDGCCGDGMGVSMLGGAVVGSTGLVGKAGRLLSNLFP